MQQPGEIMKTMPILRQTWSIIRKNPALVALGLLVAIGAGSGAIGEWWLGLLSPRPRPGTRLADFSTAPPDPSALPLPPSLSSTGPHTWAALAGLGVSLLCALLLIALLFGVLSVLARGGIIIAAADAVADRPVRLAGALRAAWTQLWRLLVILSIPLIPATLGAIALVGVYRAQFGPGGVGTLAALAAPFADPAFRTTGAVLMVPLLAVSLALGFFQVLADRACLLEGREPLDSYRRAWAVFRAHPGSLAALLAVELALRIGLGIATGLLTLTVVCRFVVPLPLLLGGLLRTYLATLWTVGWLGCTDEPVGAPNLP
jgi:hypothetical protein